MNAISINFDRGQTTARTISNDAVRVAYDTSEISMQSFSASLATRRTVREKSGTATVGGNEHGKVQKARLGGLREDEGDLGETRLRGYLGHGRQMTRSRGMRGSDEGGERQGSMRRRRGI